MIPLLSACSDQNPLDDNPQDDIDMAAIETALPYEWSHPDCPFTARFPGEPKVEITSGEMGNVGIVATYQTVMAAHYFDCDPDIMNIVENLSDYSDQELAQQYAQVYSDFEIIESSQILNVNEEDYPKLTNAVLQSSMLSRNADGKRLQNTSIIYQDDKTFSRAIYSYPSDLPVRGSGKLFFQSVRLKDR